MSSSNPSVMSILVKTWPTEARLPICRPRRSTRLARSPCSGALSRIDLLDASDCALASIAPSCARTRARRAPARSAGPSLACAAPCSARSRRACRRASTAIRAGRVCAWRSVRRTRRRTRHNHRSTTSFPRFSWRRCWDARLIQVRDTPTAASLEGSVPSYHAHAPISSKTTRVSPTCWRSVATVKTGPSLVCGVSHY